MNIKEKTKLVCRVDAIEPGFSSPNFFYSVWDGDNQVANGISSSYGFVKNDAGGYHTKEKFDELYPGGWEVEFEFDEN